MKQLVCIVCPRGCRLTVDESQNYAVTGNSCPRGAEYGKMEVTNPTRIITSTARVAGAPCPRCPVKTDRPIPKGMMSQAMAALDRVDLTAPVALGQVVVDDVCGTGARFVATRAIDRTT